MQILILILSIFIFFRTISYGIYEIKKNSNYYGGIAVIIIAIISLVYPNIIIYINGV